MPSECVCQVCEFPGTGTRAGRVLLEVLASYWCERDRLGFTFGVAQN